MTWVSSSQPTYLRHNITTTYQLIPTNLLACFVELSLHNIPLQPKKMLHISLVRSKLVYSSQLWNPYLIKGIVMLERIQHHAIKFILNDYTSIAINLIC